MELSRSQNQAWHGRMEGGGYLEPLTVKVCNDKTGFKREMARPLLKWEDFGMSWIEDFKKAYASVPTQDNEGWVPDRAGFKAGYMHAWHSQETKIHVLQAKCDDYEKALGEIRKAIDPFPQRIAHEVLAKHKAGG